MYVHAGFEAREQVKELDKLQTLDISKLRSPTKAFKAQLNRLQTNLRVENDTFNEEFIKSDGIGKILNLLSRMGVAGSEDTTWIAVGLRCLTYTFVYLTGVNYLRQRPHLFDRLFDLLPLKSATPGPSQFEVRSLVVSIYIGLCKFMKNAFTYLNRAAVNTARRSSQSPYSTLLGCFQVPDLELRVQVLTLINWMLFKCPTEKKLCKFLSRLENMGIYDDLRALAKERRPDILE